MESAHVRAALQSAIGKGLKFPSPEFEEYVTEFLNRVKVTSIESR